MRTLASGVQALLEAQRIPRFVTLVEFVDLELYLTSYPRSVTLGTKTYEGGKASATRGDHFNLVVEGIGENLDFEAPAAVLRLASSNARFQGHFFNDEFREDQAIITLLYQSDANTLMDMGWTSTYTVDADSCDHEGVVLRLGTSDMVQGTTTPKRSTLEFGCQRDFKLGGCHFRASPGLSTALNTKCDKTYDGTLGCKNHFPPVTHHLDPTVSYQQPKPYSGFLGGVDHRLVGGR